MDPLPQLVGQQRDSIQYNIYQREVDTNRELYNALLQRHRELGVEGVGLNNVAVVDQAEIPRSPSSPNILLNLLLALIAGVIAASAVVFAMVQIDERIGDPQDIKRLLADDHCSVSLRSFRPSPWWRWCC